MKGVEKVASFFVISMLLVSLMPIIVAQDETAEPGVADSSAETQTADENSVSTETQTENIPEAEFDKDPGLTPDSSFYFLDEMFERPGDDPEKALDYKEEKIAEAQAMIEQGNPEKAQQVLEKALEYGDILEQEVSPEIKERAIESSEQIINVLDDLKEQTSGEGWDIEGTFEDNIEQEENIAVAAELASKINELCLTLAKLDPLQYSDVCKSGDNSPRWMRERDKELTEEQKEQAKVFFDKLSQCMENSKNCDCKGMGIQSFEEFCTEKSTLAVKCEEGDREACKGLDEADPSDLLPDYLLDVFYKLKDKYSKSKFEKYMPLECEKAGATTPDACSKIMFKLNAPKECIDAGLDGSSPEHEKECGSLMFKLNSPQECIEAGIDTSDPDAPRKCGRLMFKLHAPAECLEAGLTGERRDDEKKCKEIMQGKEGEFGKRPTAKFDRDCNAITDANEKMKCYEQFYNNAQVGFSDDFRERELNTKEFAAKMGAANPNHPCPDGVCDQYESSHPGECPEDCGGERGQGEVGLSREACQTSTQIERLKQECTSRGEEARVENRGGCPWVVCVARYQEQQYNRQQYQQEVNVYGSFNPYVKEERQEPYEPNTMMQPGEYQPPQEQSQSPYQRPPQGEYQPGTIPGEAPATEPGTYEPPQESGTLEPATSTESAEPTTSETQSSPSSEPSGESSTVTGAVFWDYYFK